MTRTSPLFSKKAFLTTTALVAAGFISLMPQQARAVEVKVVNPDDVWVFENTAPTATGAGYVKYEGARIVDNLTQEDIGVNGFVEIDSPLTVAYGVESGPMQILGRLQSTGDVYILDVNGVYTGVNSTIDANSIVMSTGILDLDMLDASGKAVFSNVGGNAAAIDLNGSISVADAGLAAFVAPTVRNNGVINAKLGKVAFAAGETVTLDLYGDQLVEIDAGSELSDALLENAGTINAEGGTVVLSARAAKAAVDNIINMSGVINASSVSQKGGKIILSGGDKGTVNVSGQLNAAGTDGGTVEVTGQVVNITETAVLSADGASGLGGTITMLGSDELQFHGSASAIGLDGQGGNIEASAPFVAIDGSFAVGTGGTLLIDPIDLCIYGTGGACGSMSSVDFIASIRPTLISGGNVVTTNAAGAGDGDIYLVGDLSDGGFSTTSRGTWTITANDDVIFGDESSGVGYTQTVNMLVEGAGLNLELTSLGGAGAFAPFYVWLQAGSTVNTGGGDIQITAPDVYTGSGAYFDAAGGNITVDNANRLQNVAADTLRTSGTGAISVNQFAGGLIQKAIDMIENTGTGLNTINVGAGDYNESVQITEDNFVLKGANAGLAGNDAARGPESRIIPNSPGFYVSGDNTTIDGFEITTGEHGVEVQSANNVSVLNTYIHDTTNNGIYAENSHEFFAEGNYIQNSQTGIRVQNSAFARINGNVIDGITGWNVAGDGILLVDSTNATIDLNTISNVGDEGIFVRGNIGELMITNNVIDGTGQNTAASGNGIEVYQANGYAYIGNNTITNADNEGIWVKTPTASSAFEISDNTINGTTRNGILVDGGAWSVYGNTVDNTGLAGIHIMDSDYVYVGSNKIGLDAGGDIKRQALLIEGSDYAYITNNQINNARTGIELTNSDYADVRSNIIENIDGWDTMGDGILLTDSRNAMIHDNYINKVGDEGIFAKGQIGDLTISNNTVMNTGIKAHGSGNGIELYQVVGFGVVTNNTVENSDYEGIWIKTPDDSSTFIVDGNTVNGAAQNGILVDGGAWSVSGNTVDNTGIDGIHIEGSPTVVVDDNVVGYGLGSVIGDDGIEIVLDGGVASASPVIISPPDVYEGPYYQEYAAFSVFALAPTPTYAAPFTEPGTVRVHNNLVNDAGDNGIVVSGYNDITITDNTVTNSDAVGILLSGENNGSVLLAGNMLDSNDVNARFESGDIDLTGTGNSFYNGRVGMQFSGPLVTLVDGNPLDGFDGDLGTQYFDGQTDAFVELQGGALFESGQPSSYDATNSTYVTPFGTFTPSALPVANMLTPPRYAFMESMFYHYPDDNSLGLFYYGYVPGPPAVTPPVAAAPVVLAGVENFEDIYEEFGGFNGAPGALRVTITGLPNLFQGQNPNLLNNITPAAGGEENGENPDQLAAIEPAAGGENVGCWGDAMNSVEGGTTVSYTLGNTMESMLQDTAGCGLNTQAQ